MDRLSSRNENFNKRVFYFDGKKKKVVVIFCRNGLQLILRNNIFYFSQQKNLFDTSKNDSSSNFKLNVYSFSSLSILAGKF